MLPSLRSFRIKFWQGSADQCRWVHDPRTTLSSPRLSSTGVFDFSRLSHAEVILSFSVVFPHFAASDYPHHACSDLILGLFFGDGYHLGHLKSRGTGRNFADRCRWGHAPCTPQPTPKSMRPLPLHLILLVCFWFGGAHRQAHLQGVRDRLELQITPRVWRYLKSETGERFPQSPSASTLDSVWVLSSVMCFGVWFFQFCGVEVLLTRGRLTPDQGKIFTRWVNSMPPILTKSNFQACCWCQTVMCAPTVN